MKDCRPTECAIAQWHTECADYYGELGRCEARLNSADDRLGVAGGLVYTPFLPAGTNHFFPVLRPQCVWGNDLDPIAGPEFP